MNFRASKLEQQGKEFWVVRDQNDNPVSEKFKNKTQALSEAVRLNNLSQADLTNEPNLPKATATAPVEATVPSRFTNVALCRYQQTTDQCWVVASIPVDPIKQETHGAWKIERAGMNKLEADHLFKVLTAREVFAK